MRTQPPEAQTQPIEQRIAPSDTFEAAYTSFGKVLSEVTKSVELPKTDLTVVVGSLAVGQHILLEGDPGVAKTFLAKTLARAIGGTFNRVQGTPDLMPADITGTDIFNPKTGEFSFLPGPLFANVVLADELNRATPKSQSAFLEAMEEGQLTVRGNTYDLMDPFFVIATQNRKERTQGTNNLTLANLDRFAISMQPEAHDKSKMLAVAAKNELDHQTAAVIQPEDVLVMRAALKEVSINSQDKHSVADLVVATRTDKRVEADETVLNGQRPFKHVLRLAQALALSHQRRSINATDIATAARYVLPHRMSLTDKAYETSVTPHEIVAEHAGKILPKTA